MRTKILSALYFLAALIFIFAQLRPFSLTDVISKALIILLLIVLFLVNAGRMETGAKRMIFLALLFSWLGDIALEMDNNKDLMFMVGLAFFLLAHIFYFMVFILTPGKGQPLKRLIMIILPVIIYGIFLVAFLYNDLGDMRLPVIIYAIVILSMLAGAISRIGKVNSASYYLVLAGAALFVLSDSMLAINKFSIAVPAASVLIMSTYVIGQFLIVLGFLRQSYVAPSGLIY
ncbi:MAG: lysoplasmalogenase [Bacteroidales bacterium]|nr:lysoplasmalogenase [Bacteroidales bacterium]